MVTEGTEKTTIIFTYGTLKKGFSNHILLQDMIAAGDASFLGVYQTVDRLPLVCGPYRVPFLLNFPGSGEHVRGELYAVSARGLIRMDELEGITRAHYERLPIKIRPDTPARPESQARPDEDSMEVEAYYAHRNYAEALWKRNGEKGFRCYTEKEAKGYVKRKDRPQHLTFLEQIGIFISSNPNSCCCNKNLPVPSPLTVNVVNH